jgi:hypothetical protein
VALRRGLKASTLALLCLRSFSSGDRLCGSLFARKLVLAEFTIVLRGRKRSRDLNDPLERTLSLDWNFFNEGLWRSSQLLERSVRRGTVDAEGLTSEDPSKRDFGTVIQRFLSHKGSARRNSGVLVRLLPKSRAGVPSPGFGSSPAPSNICLIDFVRGYSPFWTLRRDDLFNIPSQDGVWKSGNLVQYNH